MFEDNPNQAWLHGTSWQKIIAVVVGWLLIVGLTLGAMVAVFQSEADAQQQVPSDCMSVSVIQPESLSYCFGPWAPVVLCESTGAVAKLNPYDTNGLPSLGILQFQQATWNNVANDIGRTDLVGLDPRNQNLQTTMMMAEALAFGITWGGLSHWPTCGRFYNGCHTQARITVCASDLFVSPLQTHFSSEEPTLEAVKAEAMIAPTATAVVVAALPTATVIPPTATVIPTATATPTPTPTYVAEWPAIEEADWEPLGIHWPLRIPTPTVDPMTLTLHPGSNLNLEYQRLEIDQAVVARIVDIDDIDMGLLRSYAVSVCIVLGIAISIAVMVYGKRELEFI